MVQNMDPNNIFNFTDPNVFWAAFSAILAFIVALVAVVKWIIDHYKEKSTKENRGRTQKHTEEEPTSVEITRLALVKGFGSSIVAVLGLIATTLVAVSALLITGIQWITGAQITTLIIVIAVIILLYFLMVFGYGTITRKRDTKRDDDLANQLNLGHEFKNGLCIKCGCSREAVLNFRWKCNPKDHKSS